MNKMDDIANELYKAVVLDTIDRAISYCPESESSGKQGKVVLTHLREMFAAGAYPEDKIDGMRLSNMIARACADVAVTMIVSKDADKLFNRIHKLLNEFIQEKDPVDEATIPSLGIEKTTVH